MTKKNPNAEIIRLPVGIPGVGREGDSVVFDPDNPDERYRLMAVRSLDASILPAIKERVAQAADTDAQKED